MKNAKSWLVWSLVIVGTLSLGAFIAWYLITGAVEETTDTETAVANSIPPTIAYRQIATDFEDPVDIASTNTPDDDRLFIVEQQGIIRAIDSDGERIPGPFLDISRNVLNDGEQGLLGLAFHPDYKENGRLYVNYIRNPAEEGQKAKTIIAEFTRSKSDENRIDPTSERQLLTIEQPDGKHNGGDLAFGPDGYLYIALGDGGGKNDPNNYAQNLNSFLGKILRIDPLSGDPYSVPEDNPFIARSNARPEIWSYGWRNPWRFSFDRQTGEMYIGDVGQDTYEEINREPANTPGLNYGWRCYEGDQTVNDEDCSKDTAYTAPYTFYGHEGKECSASVTGGFVYRGSQYEKLDGYYVYADFCTHRIYLANTNQYTSPFITEIGDIAITSFGESNSGEIFFTDSESGSIFQLITE